LDSQWTFKKQFVLIMNDDRMRFLSLCSVSDIECCDSTFASLQHCAARRGPVPIEDRKACRWPEVAHSCDFCGTWPSVVARCDICSRWLGLSDCRCALEKFRRPDGLYGQTIVRKSRTVKAVQSDSSDSYHTNVVDIDSDASDTESASESVAICRWCHFVLPDGTLDLTVTAPAPVGLARGLLSRIVFVLEPKINASSQWHFSVAHWIAEAILSQSGAGNIVVYGLPCDEGERAFCDAMALVQQFAIDPRRFLPSDCQWASDESADAPLPRISIVLATHSLLVDDKAHLELGSPDTVRPIDWWCNALTQNIFSRQNEHKLRVDELHTVLCNMFSAQSDASEHWQRLSDSCNIAVMAADGNVVPYLQSGLIASHICARTHQRSYRLPSNIRRFQPHAPTLTINMHTPMVDFFSFHSNQIDSVVQALCQKSTATGAKRKHDASESQSHNTRFPGRAEANERIALMNKAQGTQRLQSPKVFLHDFFIVDADQRVSAHFYKRLFQLAAARVGQQSITAEQISAWRQDSHLQLPPLQSISSIRDTLDLLDKLSRNGLLDIAPEDLSHWSLERAVCEGVVQPPPIHYLRKEMDYNVFDTALPKLRQTWETMRRALQENL
jgi:hypothetical protein